MKLPNQPRGDQNEITSHDEPIVYQVTDTTPPVTFADAELQNAFSLLTELHDDALTVDRGGKRLEDPRHHLAELALSAAAAGTTEAVTYERWSAWAERQDR